MPLPPINEPKKEDITKELDLLSKDLDKLKTSYEQYFLGLERIEPAKLRDKISKVIKKHSGELIQNARAKFRLTQLVARYNTFSSYWDRVLKEIEEGRYQRDVFKWKIHNQEKAGEKGKPEVAPKKKDPLLDLFSTYISEKKKVNEDVKNLSFDKFKAQMEAQIQSIQQKTKGANVKLMVVSEAGKVKIKAMAPATKKS